VIPTPKPVLRLKGVVIRDADGKIVKPVNGSYSIPLGETVTISVDLESSSKQNIEFAWTTVRGKVPSSNYKTNTYTATTLGSDSVTVYVWDTATGLELPELPINITVVAPVVTASEFRINEFRINKVVMKDASGNVIKPVDDIYTIKQGKTVTIIVDVTSPPQYKLEFAWTTRKGKIPPFVDTNSTAYMATTLGADLVFVLVWDTVTGTELPEVPINISVVP
jgi:hypothetical protein